MYPKIKEEMKKTVKNIVVNAEKETSLDLVKKKSKYNQKKMSLNSQNGQDRVL